MLVVRTNTQDSFNFSKVAPDVFIDSAEVYEDKITVYYHLEDQKPTDTLSSRWINNQTILNSILSV